MYYKGNILKTFLLKIGYERKIKCYYFPFTIWITVKFWLRRFGSLSAFRILYYHEDVWIVTFIRR